MPWNDTAQLNLLKPEVRESIIQMIMHVARKTPIIRFDAAMTLAKKHYQRLWFPAPGSGGAIPSRTDYSMTMEQFNKLMPIEFWREVVDRINDTMPNVLLLAEAFWLMEGYFVRTLGMHRVYNSAFMHMMMKEENEKYRQLVINTLEFNPEILKRYVNFMSNPDEETAVNQFGKGDKYFGVAVMMLTMPGLPMFGHGQIEGFSEKYGMEYKQAYYNESPDEHLVWRHKKEIFPLMKMRHLFSQVENFEFYDFYEHSGRINQNVFAFSNRTGNESVLVLYNNSYYEIDGYINYSCYKSKVSKNNSNRPQKLFEVLNFEPKLNYFYSYTDHRTQLQYLLSGKEIAEDGFKVHLFGYQYRVCLNFKEIFDEDGRYEKLYLQLNGRGVSSIDEALKEMDLLPLHTVIENLFSNYNIERLREYLTYNVRKKKSSEETFQFPGEITKSLNFLSTELKEFTGLKFSDRNIEKEYLSDINSARKFYQLLLKYNSRKNVTKWMQKLNSELPVNSDTINNHKLISLLILLTIKNYFVLSSGKNDVEKIFNDFLLQNPLARILENQMMEDNSFISIQRIKVLIKFYVIKNSRLKSAQKKKPVKKTAKTNENDSLLADSLNVLLGSNIVHNLLHINIFEGTTYFNKERFEQLLKWILLVWLLELIKAEKEEKIYLKKMKKAAEEADKLIQLAEDAGYDLNKLRSNLKTSGTPEKKKTKTQKQEGAKKVNKRRTKNKKR
jgi:hypothetical protein